jgi:hypothetical protein
MQPVPTTVSYADYMQWNLLELRRTELRTLSSVQRGALLKSYAAIETLR